jgi:hypothetical protein
MLNPKLRCTSAGTVFSFTQYRFIGSQEFDMKRIVLISMMALMAAGIFAQAQNESRRGKPDPITISGKLVLVNGHIAVQDGNTVYYAAGGVDRLFGFVDGLKEGSSVTVDGYARDLSGQKKANETAETVSVKILVITKLVIGNKSYDLPVQRNRPAFARPGFGPRRGPEPRHGYGSGPGFAPRNSGRPGSVRPGFAPRNPGRPGSDRPRENRR